MALLQRRNLQPQNGKQSEAGGGCLELNLECSAHDVRILCRSSCFFNLSVLRLNKMTWSFKNRNGECQFSFFFLLQVLIFIRAVLCSMLGTEVQQ